VKLETVFSFQAASAGQRAAANSGFMQVRLKVGAISSRVLFCFRSGGEFFIRQKNLS